MMKIMDQVLAATAAQLPQMVQNESVQTDRDQTGFDSMIRQKYQEKEPQKAADGKTAERQEPAETKEQPAAEEQSKDLQAMAAAMLLQRPAVAEPEAAVQTQEAAPAMVQEAAVPVMEVRTAEVMAETAPQQVQPQQTQTQTEQLPQMEFQVEDPSGTPEAAPVEQVLPEEEAQLQEGAADAEAKPETKLQAPEAAERKERTEETPEELPAADSAETAPAGGVEKPEAVQKPEQDSPVELEAPKGPEDLAAKVLEHLSEKDGSLCVIQLKPENLGTVRVEFSRGKDGALEILMEAANPRTTQLLEKNMDAIVRSLSESQRGEVRMEVRQSEKMFPDQWDGHQGRQQQQQQTQQQRQEQEKRDLEDFIHRLRLGLISLEDTAS